jgi:hypothetical protein
MVMRTKIKGVYMNGKLIRQAGIAKQIGVARQIGPAKQVGVATFALTLLLAFSIASASGGGAQGGEGSAQGRASAQTGGGSGDQSGGTGDMVQIRDRVSDQTGDRLKNQTRDKTMDLQRTRDRELDRELLFKDSEGKVHQWRERFNHRLQKYEAKDDPEGLARALHRVANRYRVSSDEDTGGFVDWALKNRPWAAGE